MADPKTCNPDPMDYVRRLEAENARLKTECDDLESKMWQAREEAQTYRACIGVSAKFSWEAE